MSVRNEQEQKKKLFSLIFPFVRYHKFHSNEKRQIIAYARRSYEKKNINENEQQQILEHIHKYTRMEKKEHVIETNEMEKKRVPNTTTRREVRKILFYLLQHERKTKKK